MALSSAILAETLRPDDGHPTTIQDVSSSAESPGNRG
jgi:hypothetical protein